MTAKNKIKKKFKKSKWVCEIQWQYKGTPEGETFLFDTLDDARAKMAELIKLDKKEGILARYIEDIGTQWESSWEVENCLPEKDFYAINGNGGDYFVQFAVYEQKVHKKGSKK